MAAQYYDRTGRRLSDDEARDRNGILRDGVSARVRFRDAMSSRYSASTKRHIVDGRRPNDPLSLHRPGFRVLTDNTLDSTLSRVALADAYRQHEEYLANAWRNPTPVVGKPTTHTRIVDEEKECPDCNGNGFDEDGSTCSTCGGEGTIEEDDDDFGDGRMTVDEMRRNHACNMDRIYQDHQTYLQNAWRGSK